MVSFAPKDFGTAKFKGGPATITNPTFQYRSFTPQTGRNAGTEVKLVVYKQGLLTPEGTEARGQYDVGDAQYCTIKESPAKNSDVANEGPSIANPDPSREYVVYPDSDFGLFIKSLVNGGFPESKLLDGDITALDGVEAEFYEHPKKEGDKFPLFLVKPGTVKLPGGARRASEKTNGANLETVKAAATAVIGAALDEAGGGPISLAKVVNRAMADLKTEEGKKIKGEVIKLLSNVEFHGDSDTYTYEADTKTFQAVPTE